MTLDVVHERDGRGPAWQAAGRYGIDLTLLEASLRLTPTERLDRHESALALALELERAGERRRAGRPDPPAPTR